MESYLSKESSIALSKIIDCIKNSNEYVKCINLKKEMNKDKELIDLIEEVKLLQKKYVRSNYDNTIKNELDIKIDLLNNNSLYAEYNYYLEKVNKEIDLVRDELNNYFNDLVNEEDFDS